MERINYVAFFEEIEMIQKGDRSFPSLRAPFKTISKSRTSFSILIAVEQINPDVKTLFFLKIFDPVDEMFYVFGLNGYRSKQENQFIICDVGNINFEMTGEYKVLILANVNELEVTIGETSFYVEEQESGENG